MTEMRNIIKTVVWGDHEPFPPKADVPFDVQGWNSRHRYLELSIENLRPRICIEVGVWKGKSTITLAQALRRHKIDGAVIAVDTFLGSWEHWPLPDLRMKDGYPTLYRTFQSNLIAKQLTEYVVPLPVDSVTAAQILVSRGINAAGVVHIDASHDYRSVMRDLEVWWPFVADGGVLIGDDYASPAWPEVTRAFDTFFGTDRIYHADFKCMVHKDDRALSVDPRRPAGISEILDTKYGRMIVPTHDTIQTPPLRYTGTSQNAVALNVLAKYLKELPPSPTLLDIGANIGAFSFALRPYCGEVYAYEPQPVIFNMLAGSVALNGWTNIHCFNAAVGNANVPIEVPQFDYSKACSFGSIEFGGREQRERLLQERMNDTDTVRHIPLMQLDTQPFRRVDLIKIDVEGMEFDVLDGAAYTIKRHRPALFIEHGKVGKEGLAQRLMDMGYDVQDTGADFFAVPKSN